MADLTHVAEQTLDLERFRVEQEFESLGAFAAHLVAAGVIWREQRKRSLKKCGELIAKDARAQIGEYQAAHGNFPAWAPLAESTEDEKARVGAPPDAPLLRFGDLQKSFRTELEGSEAVIIGSIDPVMEYHEFGTRKMPPRPVLGPAVFKNMKHVEHMLGSALVNVIVSGQRLGYRFNQAEGGLGPLPEGSGE